MHFKIFILLSRFISISSVLSALKNLELRMPRSMLDFLFFFVNIKIILILSLNLGEFQPIRCMQNPEKYIKNREIKKFCVPLNEITIIDRNPEMRF